MQTWYSMRAADSGAEILFYDEIGGWGVTAKAFADDLKALGDVRAITLRINSPGGDGFTGQVIHNTLRRHPAKVTAYVDGLAASAASIIAMAGDEIVMPENAMMVIHDPAALVAGGADDMRKMAGALDRIKEAMVGIYCARTDQEPDEVARMMAEETWMSAAEAVDLGFADRLEQPVAITARFDLSRYRHPPKAFMKLTTEDDLPPADEPPAAAPDAPADQTPAAADDDAVTPDLAPVPDVVPPPATDQTSPPPDVIRGAVQARAAGVTYAADVLDLCTLAGCTDRAAGFIRGNVPVAQVRAALLEARIRADAETVIDASHAPRVVGTAAEGWDRVINRKFAM